MSTSTGPTPDDEERALAHAWHWFALHSGQRMQLLSFFFVAVTVIFAAYGSALDADRPLVAVGLCVGGLVLTSTFAAIDWRTRTLIKAAEPAIASLEARMAQRAATPGLELVTAVEKARPSWTSYTKVIRCMLGAVAVMLVAGVIYGVVDAAKSNEEFKQPPACAGPAQPHDQDCATRDGHRGDRGGR